MANNIKIKICGQNNPAIINHCLDLNISYQGLIFYEKSPRFINNENIHGLVCSGDDLRILPKYNNLIKITPGVKMFARNDDQKRVTFAHNALQDGASFVVIGRELIESKKPLDLLKKYGEQYKNKNLWTK